MVPGRMVPWRASKAKAKSTAPQPAKTIVSYMWATGARPATWVATLLAFSGVLVVLRPNVLALEKRFGRKLKASVVIDPELIGGIRVVVGDEVLDTSVAARLQQMKTALVA